MLSVALVAVVAGQTFLFEDFETPDFRRRWWRERLGDERAQPGVGGVAAVKRGEVKPGRTPWQARPLIFEAKASLYGELQVVFTAQRRRAGSMKPSFPARRVWPRTSAFQGKSVGQLRLSHARRASSSFQPGVRKSTGRALVINGSNAASADRAKP